MRHQTYAHSKPPPTALAPHPSYFPPLGFIFTNLGQQEQGGPDIIVQLDGSYDQATSFRGATWVVVDFFIASSALYTETAACFHALNGIRRMDTLVSYSTQTHYYQCDFWRLGEVPTSQFVIHWKQSEERLQLLIGAVL